MKTVPSHTIAPVDSPNLVKSLLACIREAAFVIELQSGFVTEANYQAASVLGYAIDEVSTLKAEQILSCSANIFRFLRATEHLLAVPGVRLRSKHGCYLPLTVSAQAVQDGTQKVVLVVAREEISPNGAGSMKDTTLVLASEKSQQEEPQSSFALASMVGQSEPMRETFQLVNMVARSDATVLIQGESGTGKELVAEAIHRLSQRQAGPLIKVNCAALTETLLESELFGHKKGSFTGAMQDRKGRFKLADGGTLVLDEVDSLSLSGQAKLLRVLQEKEFEPVGDATTVRVDTRVIAITNADLVSAIREGRFREDLYYRLNAFPVRLPALRERKTDIPLLARHFLLKVTTALRKQIRDIDVKASTLLIDYAWPGNVRELENAIEYAAILEQSEVLTAANLPDKLQARAARRTSLKERLESTEKQIILEALQTTNGARTRTAELLGIDRHNLGYYLQKHAITVPLTSRA